MEEQDTKAETRSVKTWPFIETWVGRTTAILGLIASLGGGVTWWAAHQRQHAERQAQLELGRTQAAHGDYAAAFQTYSAILKTDPLDRSALDGQLNAAMLWDENFSVVVPEGQSAADLAAPSLDQILAALESGLARSKGEQAADVQAHLGWAHWLNQHIAEREFGTAAEKNFRAALAADPNNAYANAMLGNWMLLNGGDFDDARAHLDAAAATGKARPLVRQLQIGGFLSDDVRGARAGLIKTVNDMRKNGEALDSDSRRRILDFCFDTVVASHAELVESLSAVSSAEAWQTYLWLDDVRAGDADTETRTLEHSFIHASLLEISGQAPQSLAQFRSLQQQLAGRPGSLKDAVDAAVARLSHLA